MIPINDTNYKLYIVKKTEILTLQLYLSDAPDQEGGELIVDKISDKRIVNIKILDPGFKYIETNLPTIRIGDYYHHGNYSHSGFGEGHNIKIKKT